MQFLLILIGNAYEYGEDNKVVLQSSCGL